MCDKKFYNKTLTIIEDMLIKRRNRSIVAIIITCIIIPVLFFLPMTIQGCLVEEIYKNESIVSLYTLSLVMLGICIFCVLFAYFYYKYKIKESTTELKIFIKDVDVNFDKYTEKTLAEYYYVTHTLKSFGGYKQLYDAVTKGDIEHK